MTVVATAKITGDTHRHDNAQEDLVESYLRESCLSRNAIAAERRRGKDSRDESGIAIGGHRPIRIGKESAIPRRAA